MTARSLAATAAIPRYYLSSISRRVKPRSVKPLTSLATALHVPLENLV